MPPLSVGASLSRRSGGAIRRRLGPIRRLLPAVVILLGLALAGDLLWVHSRDRDPDSSSVAHGKVSHDRMRHQRRLISRTPREAAVADGSTDRGTQRANYRPAADGLGGRRDSRDRALGMALNSKSDRPRPAHAGDGALANRTADLLAGLPALLAVSAEGQRRPRAEGVDPPYLVTIFGMDDGDEPARMRHFLRHYLNTLALRRDRCLFALHSNFGDQERLEAGFDNIALAVLIRELLDEAGVKRADQWVLRVDSDEFLDMASNADLTNTLAGRAPAVCNYFKLAMADRVSATGELVGIQAEDRAGSLYEQYPAKCQITRRIALALSTKAAIHNGRLRTTPGGHRIDRDNSTDISVQCVSSSVQTLSHFKWVATVPQRLRRRVEQYKALGYNYHDESTRVLKYLEEHDGRFDVGNDSYCGVEYTLGEDVHIPALPSVGTRDVQRWKDFWKTVKEGHDDADDLTW
eukprot:jgi/Tetstr1/423106/TSEL_013876.t1